VGLEEFGCEDFFYGVEGLFGGEFPVDIIEVIVVETDCDCGCAEECAFDCCGDGAGVEDVDSCIHSCVDAGEDEVGFSAEAIFPESGDGEFDAICGSAIHGDSGVLVIEGDIVGGDWFVEGHAMARRGLDGEGRDDVCFAEFSASWCRARMPGACMPSSLVSRMRMVRMVDQLSYQ